MNKRRFAMLIKDLERVRDEKLEFKMGAWGVGHGCNFAGCAIGWHCHFHPRVELKLYDINGLQFPRIRSGTDPDPYNVDFDFEAVATYFEIPSNSARNLFSPGMYSRREGNITVERVLKRVKNFVLTR